MKKYKQSLYIALALSILFGIVVYEYYFYRQIPEVIYVKENKTEKFEFALPVSGNIQPEPEAVETFGNLQNGIVKKNAPNRYRWKLKLLGFIPLKDVRLEVVDEQYVYPIGSPVGIYVKSEGVLVAGLGNVKTTPTTEECPCKHVLQEGDYIVAINDIPVNLKGEVISLIQECQGTPVLLTIRRNGQISKVQVLPIANLEGDYQIGAWIRDSAQGIGTLTYVDEKGGFGALGHGINDVDTAQLLEVENGGLYDAEIVNVKKGASGNPGEISGIIRFVENAKIGDVNKNTENGIYGKTDRDENFWEEISIDKYPVGLKQEIELGHAQIAFIMEEQWDLYDIEITNIDYSQSEGNRGLVIKVTDEELIEKTGGIIQGMSGSPIIQNGKIVGAVTHVFVNDPTRGYGIFIENMLEH